MTDYSQKDIDGIVYRLNNESIRVSVFGEFSSGKTTFLNALINEDILTTAYEPTTAVPTRIIYSDLFNISVKKCSGKTIKLYNDEKKEKRWRKYIGRTSGANFLSLLHEKKETIQSFLSKWTKEGESANKVEEVCVHLPHKLLDKKIELIDTPGTNNEYTTHRKFTNSVAENTDIAILLTRSITGGISKTEFEFMNLVGKAVYKSILLINMMDLIPDKEDKNDIISSTIENLNDYWQDDVTPEVYGISAQLQLKNTYTKENNDLADAFSEFLISIEDLTESKRGMIILDRLGNPEEHIFKKAKEFENSKSPDEIDKGDEYYRFLKKILAAANQSTKPAIDGINRCESKQKILFIEISNLKNNWTELAKNEIDENVYGSLKKIYLDLKSRDAHTPAFQKLLDDSKAKVEKEKERKKVELKKQKESKVQLVEIQKDFILLKNKPKVLIEFIELYNNYTYSVSEHLDSANLTKIQKTEYINLENQIIVEIEGHLKLEWENKFLDISKKNKGDKVNDLDSYLSDQSTLQNLRNKLNEIKEITPELLPFLLTFISNYSKLLNELLLTISNNINKIHENDKAITSFLAKYQKIESNKINFSTLKSLKLDSEKILRNIKFTSSNPIAIKKLNSIISKVENELGEYEDEFIKFIKILYKEELSENNTLNFINQNLFNGRKRIMF